MELLEAIRQAKNPEVKRKLVDAYKREQDKARAHEAEVHHWMMLLTARTGYPTREADMDRAAAALAVLWEAEEEGIRQEVLGLARRHMDWNRQWVEGLRKRLEAMGKQVEVPDPVAPF